MLIHDQLWPLAHGNILNLSIISSVVKLILDQECYSEKLSEYESGLFFWY